MPNVAPQPTDIRRYGIGILAVALLLTGVALWITGYDVGGMKQVDSMCMRIAIVLGLWWLAYPELNRVPRWFWFAIPAVLFLALVRFRWLLVVIPIMIGVGYVQSLVRKR